MFSLNQKTVVITGGAGQLGSAYSAAFLRKGAYVACLDLERSEKEVKNQDEFPGDYKFIQTNLTKKDDVEAALIGVKETFGTPHVLVNNAAIDTPPNSSYLENGPFETYPEESWDEVMNANLKSMFMTCQVFGRDMSEANQSSSIINISSIYGLVSPDQSLYDYRRSAGEDFYKPVAYSVTKSGVLNFSRYLAVYWATKNVRVNTLTLSGLFNNQDDEFLRSYCERIPIGRMANADDFLGPLIFLASDASVYMTGANLVIDGGWTAI